jgi:SagB-type dehydrogenase family enzyme
VREGGVEGLEAGAYHYEPHSHTLEVIARGDYSQELMAAAVDQPWVASAAFNIVITAVPQRTIAKYGDRSWQYIWQESGHAGQNVYLEATALNLGNTVIGAFYENEVRSILRIPQEELPVYIATLGTPKV